MSQTVMNTKKVKLNIQKSSKANRIRIVLIFIPAVILSILWLIPLLWSLSTSIKPEGDVIDVIIRWIPKKFSLQNFKDIFSDTYNAPILRWFLNSLFIATVHTIFILIIDSLAAYAYARLEFKGKEFLFWALMTTMMIPTVMNFIPNFIICDKLHWVDTPIAMIVPGLGGVFGIFLLRQFFEGLPKELDESAKLEGAGAFTIYLKIILPLCRPALITLAVFTFLGNWNDFLWPMIVTNDTFQRTLPAGLANFQGVYTVYYGKLMAGAIVSIAPPLLLFLAGQKYFIEGVAMSGMKD